MKLLKSKTSKTVLILPILLTLVLFNSTANSQVISFGGEREYASWDGLWNTNYGRMELAQTDDVVVGFYDSDEGIGRIRGTVEDDVLSYTWILDAYSGGTYQGPGELTISVDGQSFDGWWSYDYDVKSTYEWSSSKIGERELTEELSEPEYCLWRGTWETKSGRMVIEQELGSSEITGTILIWGAIAELTGISIGWGIDFTFDGDIISGNGYLEMNPSLDGFTGSLSEDPGIEDTEFFGSFVSAAVSESFSGTWDTNWGTMVIRQDESGIAMTTIENAQIGNWVGQIELEGLVLGPTLSYRGEINAGNDIFRVSGTFTHPVDDDTISGTLIFIGDETISAKITGRLR